MSTPLLEGDWQPTPYGEPWSPAKCEEELYKLMQMAAQAELRLRAAVDQETDAKISYEREHLLASTDPMCPVVERGGSTVAERDDWIRGVEFVAWEWLQTCTKVVKHCQRYQERVDRQVSIVQTMAKLCLASYQVIGSSGRG